MSFSHQMRRVLSSLLALALGIGRVHAATGSELPSPPAAATSADSTPATGDTDFFGLTNLWTVSLTISPEAWDLMSSGTGPRRPHFGGVRSEGFFVDPGALRVENPPPAPSPAVAPTPSPATPPPPPAPSLWDTLVRLLTGGSSEPPPPPAPVSVARPMPSRMPVPVPAPMPGGPEFPGMRQGRIFPADLNAPKYPWATCTFEAAGQVLTNVAIRFKGVSSMVRAPNGYKRPFKLDFNRDAKGRRFQGLGELYLNNNVNDATQMREALAYDLFRRAGIAAPRTAFARVVLTVPGRVEQRMLGLYTVVEAVEGDFLARAFGTKKGMLMKPEMMAGLQYLGDDWAMYRDRYHPENSPGEVDPALANGFIGFLREILQTVPERFAETMTQRLEPEGFGRFVALHAILANVDSFIGNGHNYYLHVHPTTQRLTFIPWDLNESFGVHPVSGPSRDQLQTSVLFPNADPNALVERWVTDATLGPRYRGQLAWVLTNFFVPAELSARVDRVAAVTRPVVFAESARAKVDFERTVLGTLAPGEGDTSQPRFDREFQGEPYRPWSFPEAVEVDNLPLKTWIGRRYDVVREQLEGRSRGTRPKARLFQMQ